MSTINYQYKPGQQNLISICLFFVSGDLKWKAVIDWKYWYTNNVIDQEKSRVEWIIKKRFAQRGARTHDPEIKSLVLYRLS